MAKHIAKNELGLGIASNLHQDSALFSRYPDSPWTHVAPEATSTLAGADQTGAVTCFFVKGNVASFTRTVKAMMEKPYE